MHHRSDDFAWLILCHVMADRQKEKALSAPSPASAVARSDML
ncbi:MAG: hypothetical protein ACK5QW_10805 [Cyanobacteriota bacterium]|jgi:hypothetical protein